MDFAVTFANYICKIASMILKNTLCEKTAKFHTFPSESMLDTGPLHSLKMEKKLLSFFCFNLEFNAKYVVNIFISQILHV